MKKELFDRETETQEISTFINTKTTSNKIILLSGVSGVGKSGLIEKLEQNKLLSMPIIFVKISKSSVDTIENLQYFNTIYRTVVNSAKEKKINNMPTPTKQGIRNFKNIFKILWSLVRAKSGMSEALPIAEPIEDQSIIRKKDYLLHITKNTNLILDIENIQNIDTQSFEILKEIIRSSTLKTFILEYTLTENDYEHYQNLYKELSETDAEIYAYKVEKMDFCYAQKLAPLNIKYNENELQYKYDKSNGNLMEIILATENSSLTSSNIVDTITHLTKNEKYVLYLIFLNNSSITYNEPAVRNKFFQTLIKTACILYVDNFPHFTRISKSYPHPYDAVSFLKFKL